MVAILIMPVIQGKDRETSRGASEPLADGIRGKAVANVLNAAEATLRPRLELQTALDCAIASQLAYQVPDEETVRVSGLECLHVFPFDVGRSQGVVIEQADRIVVAYRGTTYEDLITNVKLRKTAGPFGRVHRGFLAYAALPLEFIRDRLCECPGKAVLFTGHSLGGAAAVLAAALLQSQIRNRVLSVVTFGAPRVGDSDFAAISHYLVPHHRWVHANDGVPWVPPMLRDYRHSGYLHYITQRGTIWHRADPAFALTMADYWCGFRAIPGRWTRKKISDHRMIGYTSAIRAALDREGGQ